MAKEWTITINDGGQTGQLLDGCEIRQNADGSYDLLAVLATHPPHEAPFPFPPFAYRDFIWNVEVGTFEYGPDRNEVHGSWLNNANKPSLPGDESGTYTGQAGPGAGEEDKEDAASASA